MGFLNIQRETMRSISSQRIKREHERHAHFLNINSPEIFQIMNVDWFIKTVRFCLKISGLKNKTYRNALELKVAKKELFFPNLPVSFDGYTILLMTDLHIDGMTELPGIINNTVKSLNYDICLLGGDYRFNIHGDTEPTITGMEQLLLQLCPKTKVAAVLGNHDEYKIAQGMEKAGATMLMNEQITITRNNERIYICGVDDCHYYGAHNLDLALENVEQKHFKILLSHSPEIYKEAEKRSFDLCLAGHTHAGQLCLPGRFPIICESSLPRKMIYDSWHYKSMQGYTSAGTGSSGTPARLNCPPEVVLLTLRSS